MLSNYVFGAHAVLLCYDITNFDSFQNLEDWYRLVQTTFKGQPLPRVTLIGNKTDLNHLRTVKVCSGPASLAARFNSSSWWMR